MLREQLEDTQTSKLVFGWCLTYNGSSLSFCLFVCFWLYNGAKAICTQTEPVLGSLNFDLSPHERYTHAIHSQANSAREFTHRHILPQNSLTGPLCLRIHSHCASEVTHNFILSQNSLTVKICLRIHSHAHSVSEFTHMHILPGNSLTVALCLRTHSQSHFASEFTHIHILPENSLKGTFCLRIHSQSHSVSEFTNKHILPQSSLTVIFWLRIHSHAHCASEFFLSHESLFPRSQRRMASFSKSWCHSIFRNGARNLGYNRHTLDLTQKERWDQGVVSIRSHMPCSKS